MKPPGLPSPGFNPLRDDPAIAARLERGFRDAVFRKRGARESDADAYSLRQAIFDGSTANRDSVLNQEPLDPTSWPIETWRQAAKKVSGMSPEAFGGLFSTVVEQALAARDFKAAREMAYGLATLRASSDSLAPRSDYAQAHRAAFGRDNQLASYGGLHQALSAIAKGPLASVWEAARRLFHELAPFDGPRAKTERENLRRTLGRLSCAMEAKDSRAHTEALKGAVDDLERARRSVDALAGFQAKPGALIDLPDHFDPDGVVATDGEGLTSSLLARLTLEDSEGHQLILSTCYRGPPEGSVATVTTGGQTYAVTNRAEALLVQRIVDEARRGIDPREDFALFHAARMASSMLDGVAGNVR
jgi:hypothetical protein